MLFEKITLVKKLLQRWEYTYHATPPVECPCFTLLYSLHSLVTQYYVDDSHSTGLDALPIHTAAVTHLSKLSPPYFTGNPLLWQTFWDSFNAAFHSNPIISKVKKFNYLQTQLQDDATMYIRQ